MGSRISRRNKRKQLVLTLQSADYALLFSLGVLRALRSDQELILSDRQPPFPLSSPNEYAIVDCAFTRYWYGAVGNGSYSSFLAFGSTPLALAAAASTLASVNRAAADATDAWRMCDSGQMWLTGQGFYLHTFQGPLFFSWNGISELTLLSLGSFSFTTTFTDGSIKKFMVRNDCAELATILWAAVRMPAHWVLDTTAWIPNENRVRLEANGYDLSL